MNLSSFLALLARRKWIVLLCMLIPAIIVAINYWVAQPQYSVVTTLEMDTSAVNAEEYNELLQFERLINAYVAIASNDDVVIELTRPLALDQPPQVDARVLPDSNLISLSVRHPDSDSAQAVTDEIVGILTAQSLHRAEFRNTPLSVREQSNEATQSTSITEWLKALLLWSLIGFAIGALLAYIRDAVDPKLRSTVEIEHAAQLHTIAELPILNKNEPLVFLNGTSAQSEAYRSLRTILSNYGGTGSIKTLLLTSAKSGEGKSTIAANLGIAMAQSGRKILLVDCDMRKPAISEILDIPNVVGVSNILLKQTKLSESIRHLAPYHLDVITSGPPVNIAAELLNSSRMVSLIRELETMYDMVIFDTPAILPVTDAVVLSRLVSAVVLIVGKDQVEGRDVQTARHHLRSVGVEPIGIIINRVKPRESKYYN